MNSVGKTFETIQDETYSITDIEVVGEESDLVVLRYAFHWSGLVDGSPRPGSGRGTNVITHRDGWWVMLHEHLSP